MNAENTQPNLCARCGRRLALGEACTLCHVPVAPEDPPLPPTKPEIEHPLTGAESVILTSVILAVFGARPDRPLSIFLSLIFWALLWMLFFNRWEPSKRRIILTVLLSAGTVIVFATSWTNPNDITLTMGFLVLFLLSLGTLFVHKQWAATLLKVALITWSLLIIIAPHLLIVR